MSQGLPALQSMTDEMLMLQYLSGDILAFKELYQRLSPKTYGYLLKKLTYKQDAEEVLQAVFLKFHLSRHHYDPKYPIVQWIFVISKTAIVDFYRKKSRQPKIDPSAEIEKIEDIVGSSSIFPSEVSQMDDPSTLDSLSEAQRQLIRWRFLDELDYEAIATRLNKSQSAVRQMLSRTLKRIRETKLKEDHL